MLGEGWVFTLQLYTINPVTDSFLLLFEPRLRAPILVVPKDLTP